MVALTGKITEPHPVAAVAGAGHHTAPLVTLDVFNHTPKVTNSTFSVNPTIVTKYDKTCVKNDKTFTCKLLTQYVRMTASLSL